MFMEAVCQAVITDLHWSYVLCQWSTIGPQNSPGMMSPDTHFTVLMLGLVEISCSLLYCGCNYAVVQFESQIVSGSSEWSYCWISWSCKTNCCQNSLCNSSVVAPVKPLIYIWDCVAYLEEVYYSIACMCHWCEWLYADSSLMLIVQVYTKSLVCGIRWQSDEPTEAADWNSRERQSDCDLDIVWGV